MLFTKKLFLQLIIISAISIIHSSCLFAQWELVIDRDSIQVYNKPNSDGFSYYKAKAYIFAPANKVAAFLTDIEGFPQWVNNCAATTIIQRTNNEIIYRAEYDMPWPVTNRYSISRLTINKETEGVFIFKTQPIQIDSLSIKDAILISRFREQVSLKQVDTDLTVIEMSGAYDPAGAIPSWLTDKFMKYGPYDMVLKIREGAK